MMKPEQHAAVLFVSPQSLRILLPFTEEVLAEWSFSQLSSYSLAPGGLVTLTVARTRLTEPTWALIRTQGAKSGTCDFVFSSLLQHKDIYEAMENCWRKNKELHDKLFQEVVTCNSPTASESKLLKPKRMSLNFSRSAVEDVIERPATKDDDALKKSPKKWDEVPMRPKSGTLTSFFQRKSSANKLDAGAFPGLPLKYVSDQTVQKKKE
jgi:hypothetical protein